MIRTVTAVERADVVVVMIDASEGVTEQDAKIAGIAHEKGKGVIIAVNKWDAIEKNDKTIYKHTNSIGRSFPLCLMQKSCLFLPEQDSGFPECLRHWMRLSRIKLLRIQTGVLNEILAEAVPCSSRRLTGKTSENFLYDTGCGKTAYICYLCQ